MMLPGQSSVSIVSPQNYKHCAVAIFLLSNDTGILISLSILVKNYKKYVLS